MTETLSWIHFGDLHISNEGEQNHVDFQRLIAEANRYMRGDIAFALLPGDNADDAEADQYEVVKKAVSLCEFPVEAITGDHDKAAGNLRLFEDCFHEPLPRSFTRGGGPRPDVCIVYPGRPGLGDRQHGCVRFGHRQRAGKGGWYGRGQCHLRLQPAGRLCLLSRADRMSQCGLQLPTEYCNAK